MSLTTIDKKTDAMLRIVPSAEQQAAVGALAGCAFCLFILSLILGGGIWMRFSLLYLVLILSAVAMILRRQQRTIEISVPDACLYFIGRRKRDVYSIPFGMVESLRLTRRTSGGELVDSALRRSSGGRQPFHLDLILKDAGFETLDRSVLGPDLAATALEIAEKTGFAIEDHADIGFSRAATKEYPPQDISLEERALLHSTLRETQEGDGTQFFWSLSPGKLYLALMALAAGGLVYGGGYGAFAAAEGEESTLSGIILLFVCGFFGYMILWRMVRAVAGRGFLWWDTATLRFGNTLLGKEYASVLLELRDVQSVKVLVPRVGKARVEATQESGERFILADVSSPLAPLSTGDLHWLAGKLRTMLRK
ncbi:MAG: hypothetical protein MI749_03030 [Desulfovibrionales bacterium]|nr:hypothetical protein [Desulfovibrionales bacterium]